MTHKRKTRWRHPSEIRYVPGQGFLRIRPTRPGDRRRLFRLRWGAAVDDAVLIAYCDDIIKAMGERK